MPSQVRAKTADRGYGSRHQAQRRWWDARVAAGRELCRRCGERILPGEPWDLGHVDGNRRLPSRPEHARCNRATAGRRWEMPAVSEPKLERVGLAATDKRWRVPWLRGLRTPPAGAVWPRYMTVPHPSATGSMGRDFVRWAEAREGRALRWWQRLVATRLLETDADGRLVWETLLLSMARQLGKSWLLRELLLWRMHQADRFGEPQDVLHTGKDLQVCKEVLRPALYWAEEQPGYKVGRANGEQYIEWLEDRSRWMLRAKTSTYGYSVSVAAVDEAWKVKPEIIDEGVAPTMVERAQPQLWLISTAHREATALMLSRRRVALENLEVGDGDLLVEWSAPRTAELADVSAWRMASPHWTAQRERLIGKQLEAVLAGEGEVTEDEADPVEAFKGQWLNIWPDRTNQLGAGEPLLPPGLWEWLTEPDVGGNGDLFVALENQDGYGAAVAMASILDDGRIEVDGCICPDWDSALLEVERLKMRRRVRELTVGASLQNKVLASTITPVPNLAGGTETMTGLPLLRDLATGAMLVHDKTTRDLDDAVGRAQVKMLSSGVTLVRSEDSHLVRALVWAVQAAHRPAPVPAVY